MTTDHGIEKTESSDTSEVVDQVAKLADSKVTTLLFGRAAKAAGNYLGEKAEDFFKQLRQSKNKNIVDHISKVVDVTGAPLPVEEFQFVRIERWVKVAADVPLEDVARSAVVEAVLADIASKSEETAEFQDAAEKMTNSTARLLLNARAEQSVTPTDSDKRSFEQLEVLGLAHKPDRKQVLNDVIAWIVGTIVGLIVLFGVIIRFAPSLFLHFPYFLESEFVADAVVISAAILALGLIRISTKYRLTQLGKALQRSANRFYRDKSDVRRKSVFPPIPRLTWMLWGTFATLLICTLPFALQAYLPLQLRMSEQPPTVIVSSPPPTPTNPPLQTPPSATATASPQGHEVTLSSDQIRALGDFWRSVTDQMKNVLDLTNDSSVSLQNWPQRIRNGGKQTLLNELVKQRNTINQRRISLEALYNAYREYPNVSAALENPASKGFIRLYQALDTFVSELQNLETPPPENFESTLRPYADELKGAIDAMAKWATSTSDFAQRQTNELNQTPR